MFLKGEILQTHRTWFFQETNSQILRRDDSWFEFDIVYWGSSWRNSDCKRQLFRDELLVGRYDARFFFPKLAGWSQLKSVAFPNFFASREPPFPQNPTTFSYGKDCVWGAWSDWGDCSKCGGQRYRQRSVIKMPNVAWYFWFASGKGRWRLCGLVWKPWNSPQCHCKKELKLYLRKIWVVASIGKLKEQVKFQHFFVWHLFNKISHPRHSELQLPQAFLPF